ncbi:hypothetical protein CLAIMM_00576 [Cladophialophora immunda]|nr:hypothetical protein CLAIMM_00576 [Cladophialophora immunda]
MICGFAFFSPQHDTINGRIRVEPLDISARSHFRLAPYDYPGLKQRDNLQRVSRSKAGKGSPVLHRLFRVFFKQSRMWSWTDLTALLPPGTLAGLPSVEG